MYRIVLADDHLPTLQRFELFLKKEGFTVDAKVENGYGLVKYFKTTTRLPDLALVDINMPVMDGIAVTYYLKIHFPSVKVIALSVYGDERTVSDALLSLADGYVIKAFCEKVLPGAIASVMQGQVYIDRGAEMDAKKINYLFAMRKKNESDTIVELSLREREFAMLNATPLSYAQIGELMCIETKSVEAYCEKVAKKLGVNSRHALALTCLQNGLARMADFKAASRM